MPKGEAGRWKPTLLLCLLPADQHRPHSADLTSRLTPYPAFKENRGSVGEMIVIYWDTIMTQPETNLVVCHTWHKKHSRVFMVSFFFKVFLHTSLIQYTSLIKRVNVVELIRWDTFNGY